MNSINNKSIIKTLENYLSAYKSIFYKRSFKNFVVIITAILYMQEVKSIKLIYDKFIKKFWNICLNSFYYFLADKNFDASRLALATLEIALSLIPEQIRNEVSIYLLIDDTLQAKFGENFDCYGKLFDHTRKNGSLYLNGHCFVSLTLSIPIVFNNTIRYLSIPIQYKLYDKSKTKLKLAADMIDGVAPKLGDYQIIVVCDSWYTKKPLINSIKKHKNFEIIGALRSDTTIYSLEAIPTGKRGRPRTKGERLSYRNFSYQKDGDFYITNVKVKINLCDAPVFITVTTTDINTFSSVRLYMSTINPDDINSFNDEINKAKNKTESNSIFNIYKIRWNIEVIFYQQKTFWSFGNYMVRHQEAITKYVNLIGVAYSLAVLLPFMNNKFSQYKFQSPQEVKYHISDCLIKELIFSNLLKTLQVNKNIVTTDDILDYLTDDNLVS
jgi:hypothetical protein